MAESKKQRKARAAREAKARLTGNGIGKQNGNGIHPTPKKKTGFTYTPVKEQKSSSKSRKTTISTDDIGTHDILAPEEIDGKKKKEGRPRIFEGLMAAEVEERLISALSVGAYIETAVAYAGISKDTFYAWLKRGAKERKRIIEEKPEPSDGYAVSEAPFLKFSDAIERAIAGADIRDITIITRAAQSGAWQAAAWRQERKHPKMWGRQRIEVTGADGAPLQTAPSMVILNMVKRNPDGTMTVNGESGENLPAISPNGA